MHLLLLGKTGRQGQEQRSVLVDEQPALWGGCALVCNACQFLWCKYFTAVNFKAARNLKMDLQNS